MIFLFFSITFSTILAMQPIYSMESLKDHAVQKSTSIQSFQSDGDGWLVFTDTPTISHNNDGLQLQNPAEFKETEHQESYTADHDSPPVTQGDIKKKDRTSIHSIISGEDSACSTTSSVSDNLNILHEHQKIRSHLQSPRASSENIQKYLDQAKSIVAIQPTHASNSITRDRTYSNARNHNFLDIISKTLASGLTALDVWFDKTFPDIQEN